MTEHPRLDELIATLERLRAPGGCAWDGEQTHASLVRYLVEETFELVEAIENGTREDLLEELGDVLYQVVFHADIAAHTPGEDFGIEDVAAHMTAKMVGRHPHVFGTVDAETADDVVALWDEVKKAEKPERRSVLDGIPLAMPALALADKVAGRAEKVGAEPIGTEVPDTEDELGAMLMGIVVGARSKGLDPERAMRAAVRSMTGDIRSRESAAASVGDTEVG
jgi:XTP/dITP diphosphohydrolase